MPQLHWLYLMTVFTGAGPPAPPPPPAQRQQRTTRVRRADGNVFTVDVGGNVKPGTYKHANARRITCQNCQAVITGFSSFQGEHITCEANLLCNYNTPGMTRESSKMKTTCLETILLAKFTHPVLPLNDMKWNFHWDLLNGQFGGQLSSPYYS